MFLLVFGTAVVGVAVIAVIILVYLVIQIFSQTLEHIALSLGVLKSGTPSDLEKCK